MTNDRTRLDGRVVVVVGAGGGGIGTAVSGIAAERGATVVGLDNDADNLDITRDALEAAGGRFVGLVADVRRKDQVDRAFAELDDAVGRVDALVNVVGGQQPHHWQPLLDFPLEHLEEVLDLNLRYAILTCQAAARRMIASGDGGAIVNVASVAGFTSTPFSMAYGAAKAALVSVTRTMAVEWGRYAIRANVVAPGTIRTPRDHSGDIGDAEMDGVLALKRRGTPEEVATAVLFAISDLASFMTGQEVIVDGGSLVRPSYLDAHDLPVVLREPSIRARLLGGAEGPA